MDYQSLLYNPIYDALGVPAVILGKTVTVIDKTAGVAIADKTQIETIRPVANVRAKELSEKSLIVADLPENIINFNGNNWRIKACRAVPSPNGIADGEYILILLNEDFYG